LKYSFMSFSCPELKLGELFELARKYSYEGIEPRIGSGHNHGIELGLNKWEMNDIKRQVEKSGIEICCIATSCVFADSKNTQENIGLAKQAVDLASRLNCKAIRVFGGNIPEEVGREKASGVIANALRNLAEYAAERDVVICLETHDDWCNPIDAADIMNRVASPDVAINWDIMHPVLWAGFTVEESFRILSPWIKHVHMHDGINEQGKLVFKHMGTGSVDHKTAIGLLKKMGYNGFISGEWIGWEPYETHLPGELAIIKKYEELTGD
jgi:sugar phosphate isomerase/epimerase